MAFVTCAYFTKNYYKFKLNHIMFNNNNRDAFLYMNSYHRWRGIVGLSLNNLVTIPYVTIKLATIPYHRIHNNVAFVTCGYFTNNY